MKKMRKAMELIQYDYVSKEEFEKHAKDMKERGWKLVGDDLGRLGDLFGPGEVSSEDWTYTASYVKSDFM